MDTIIGTIELLAIVALVLAWRGRPPQHPGRSGRTTAHRPKATPPASTPLRPSTLSTRDDQTMNGWMLGHAVRHGHHAFPGDPLPGGHIGSARDIAFWAGMADDDDSDDM